MQTLPAPAGFRNAMSDLSTHKKSTVSRAHTGDEVRRSRPASRAAAAAVIALVCICLFARCLRDGGSLSAPQLALTVGFIAACALLCLIPKPLPAPASAALAVLIPVGTFFLLEQLTHELTYLLPGPIILNLIFYWIVYAFFWFLTGRMSIGYILATCGFGYVGLFNYFVMTFRGNPIVPWDLQSYGTAMSVAGNYVYEITPPLFLGVTGMLALCVLAWKCGLRLPGRARLIGVFASAIVGFGFWQYVASDDCYDRFDPYDIPFTEWANNRYDGFFVNFMMSTKYLRVQAPAGYSAERAAELLAAYLPEGNAGSANSARRTPDVIVILNEAFSDLRVLGDLETSEPVMPYYESLIGAENTVTGHMYCSVLGGNTANTEFEILTGNTCGFLPAGSIPFQQFITGELPSAVWAFTDAGYSTTGMHPYPAEGWNRDHVYPWLGFEELLFEEEFTTHGLVRVYLSDAADFEMVERVTAANAADPSFVFNVTMQNHGSYFRTYSNFRPDIRVNGQPLGTYPKAETYLSLIRMSDEALEDLLAYYAASDRDTVIVMFGDHQPTLLESELFEEVLGKPTDDLTPEENAARFIVPYLIWANFDIEEAQGVDLSANYLLGEMMDACGIDPAAMAGHAANDDAADTPAFSADLYMAYQGFLADVRAEYPVVTANFYYDAADAQAGASSGADSAQINIGAFHVMESAGHLPALLQDYAVIQYGLLFEPEAVAAALE